MVLDGGELPSTTSARWTVRAPVTAWLLALLPVSWVVYDVLAAELFGASDPALGAGATDSALGSLLFAVLTNWIVVGVDTAALRRTGVRVSAWWGVLFLPVYVILRTKRASSSILIPVVFFALAATYVLVGDRILNALP